MHPRRDYQSPEQKLLSVILKFDQMSCVYIFSLHLSFVCLTKLPAEGATLHARPWWMQWKTSSPFSWEYFFFRLLLLSWLLFKLKKKKRKKKDKPIKGVGPMVMCWASSAWGWVQVQPLAVRSWPRLLGQPLISINTQGKYYYSPRLTVADLRTTIDYWASFGIILCVSNCK